MDSGRHNLSTLAACLAGAVLVSQLLSWRQKTKKLPPGPPKLPLLDNIHNMPAGLDWIRFAEIGKECGSDVIHLGALGTSIVVLNSFEAARELLDKRSGIYSARFESTVINELGQCNVFFAVAPTGDYWRACRRMFMKHLGPTNNTLYRLRDSFYVHRFLYQLHKSPDDLLKHIRHLVGATSISMTYGLKPRARDDPNIQLVEDFAAWTSELGASGTFLVDVFPSLKHLPPWFPGATFHQVAAKTAEYALRSRKGLLEQALEAMKAPDYMPSFVSKSLQDIEDDPQMSEEERRAALLRTECTAVQIYTAAADTTASAISTFFLAMVCHPEVQQKLQQELDNRCHGRMPTHDDLTNLPYLTAVIWEVLRWKPVVPSGLPHKSTVDDIYRGYHIPKNSILVANQWAMLHNADDYPEPDVFRPERFLRDGKIDKTVRDPTEIAFGFGRRICPGRHIAQSLLTLTIASVLSNFNVLKKTDENGNIIEPTQEIHPGIICHPKDFTCVIQPRSSQVRGMLDVWALHEDESV